MVFDMNRYVGISAYGDLRDKVGDLCSQTHYFKKIVKISNN